jgi:long-chain acyl-CoA synthetase
VTRYLTFLETPWEGADTLASLFEQSAKKNAGNKCLGHRRVIKREEYFDAKSKRNFEKLTLGEYQFQTYQQVGHSMCVPLAWFLLVFPIHALNARLL